MKSVGGLAALSGGDVGTGTPEKSRRGNGKANGERKTRAPKSTEGATGRLDRSGNESVVSMDPVRANMSDLEALHGKKTQASIAYREKVKKIAEESGMLSSSINALVVARVADKFDDRRRQYEQLSLLFSEVGED